MILREIKAALSLLKSCNKTENLELEFQEFVDELLVVVSLVDKELKSIAYSKVRKRRLKSCLHQLKAILKRIQPVLGPLFSVPDVMKIYSGRLCDCLLAMIDIIEDPDGEEVDEGFIRQLNLIRTLLKEPVCPRTLLVEVNSLLVHALTIAKLCTDDGFNEISASCKKVLEAAKSFEVEGCDTEFLVHSCSVHLGSLERQVNIAMLQLFLEVMSNPSIFVKELVKKCLLPNSLAQLDVQDDINEKITEDVNNLTLKTERKPSDLDEFIVNFDLACDRLELIGNYSIASSEDDDTRIDVEIALSTLAYCSNSLIPAILSYYTNPTSKVTKSAAKLLVTEWIETVQLFNDILDFLVDPANLVQVAIEDFRCLIHNLSVNNIEATSAVTQFTTKCLRVIKLLEICTDLKIPLGVLEPLKKKLTHKSNLKRLRRLKCVQLIPELEELVQMLDEATIERLGLLMPCGVPESASHTGLLSPVGDIDSAFDLLDAAFPSTASRQINGTYDFKVTDGETPKRQMKSNFTQHSPGVHQLTKNPASDTTKTPTTPEAVLAPVNKNSPLQTEELKTPNKTSGQMEKENTPGQWFHTPRLGGMTPGRKLFPVLTPFLDKAVGTSPFTPVSFPQRSTHRIVIQVKGDPALYKASSCDVSESDC